VKILQVNKFFYIKGGSEAYLFSIIEGLKENEHIVAEFSMKNPKNRASDWAKYFVEQIDYETQTRHEKIYHAAKIIYSFQAQKRIGKLLEFFQPDIAHLHIFQHQLSPSILPEIKNRGIPIVYTAHDLKSICPNYKMLTQGRVCELCRGRDFYHCLWNRCTKNSFSKSLVNVIEMYVHNFMSYYEPDRSGCYPELFLS
jgi:glycosyltransferase involved in cell wall biosynthesis